ncbi:hypothetical protein KDD30_13865 [Photobacterium sp. GJ3]|uniref:hypothetical protein n=1 Tax=Photobacterium sp. GJ3 TaxID=2829502 RepID=UPI001B8C4C7D|nr:hypothetical protein [Photobacterium sp. GJ3]QUJ67136.1 hypothetical protein KDD30_13865 [Photobacterium sp. GJ3]
MGRILDTFVAVVLIGLSYTAQALEFGRYDVLQQSGRSSCINVICQINFSETYSQPPLVFLMDTVSFRNEQDLPSSLRIISVTNTYVRFSQQTAPRSRAPATGQEIPMLLIDFLVIEEGVQRLGNTGVLVAGTVTTDRFLTQVSLPNGGNQRKGLETLLFRQLGLTENFSDIPGIIHQVQTVRNGENFWLTSAVANVQRDRFSIALERSEIDGGRPLSERTFPQQPETIAFVAALGTGNIDGVNFELGSQQTLNTINQPSPVSAGCETFASYGPFDSIPILLANKNSRVGNNGGWVRRCRIEPGRASFMVDEDMDFDAERGHLPERVGFIIFERPFEIEQCRFFNGPVQTWDPTGTAQFLDNAQVIGVPVTYQIGFANVTNENSNSCAVAENGLSSACVADPSRLVDKPEFMSFPTRGPRIDLVGDSVTIPPGVYEQLIIDQDVHVSFSGGITRLGTSRSMAN